MSTVRQIGIRMTVDAQSVTTELPKAGREFTQFGATADQAAAKATRSLAQVQMSVRDMVAGAGALHIVGASLSAISQAITAMPRNAFDYSKNLEVSQVGMAGILGSMTAINGQQTTYNQGLALSSEYIRKLNDDALRTAATSQELTSVFQALLAPGLSAKMSLEEIRQLTVVGTNAVKSMGMEAGQVVQELRDLVQGGITPASSTLASALGLKDSDIAKAKASSEGLFKFLMDRLQGFQASSEAFSETLSGKLDQVKEGATRVAADGMKPLVDESKRALDEISKLFVTFDQAGNATLNQELVAGIREFSEGVVVATTAGRELVGIVWDNRDAAVALAAAWVSLKAGSMAAEVAAAAAAKMELANASRLAAAQSAAEAAGNVQVVMSSQQKLAAYLAELEAKVAAARADAAAQAAQIATLNTTREAIVVARSEVVAKLDAVRATMAQAEAQMVAARAAGAQSMALALVREGTEALTAAQARQAILMTELATLGKQQAGVNAALATATAAQTAATNAASAAAGGLAAAQGAASVAGRALSGVAGFLGGPIGILTTALTLGATAWALWGGKAEENIKKVEKSVFENAADLRAELRKQIELLERRNAAARGTPEVKNERNAEVLGGLQQEIDRLQSQKTENAAQEIVRVTRLQAALREYGETVAVVRDEEKKRSGQVTLTSQAALQAFEKTVDGAKTASAAQLEYTQKVDASRTALEALRSSGADSTTLSAAQKKFDESEKAWAAERDKKIKEMGASAATAHSHAIDAQIAAIQQGYKLLTAKTADALDELQTLRQLDLVSEYDAVQRKAALQAKEMDAQRSALQAELELVRAKKDSAKERANLEGQLAELEQKRINLQRTASRDLQVLLVKPQLEQVNALRQSTAAVHDQAEALELQNRVYGQSATALIDLTIAQLEKQRLDLEATDNVIPGYIEALERQIAAQKRLRAAMGEKVAKDWAKEYQTESERASERVRETVQRDADQINQSLSDAIMDGGKSGGQLLEDYFRTLVLKPTISAIMSPVSMAVSATVNGGLSALGLAGNAASAASGMGSLGGLGGILGGAGTAAGYGAQALFAGNGLGAFTGGLGMLTSGGTAATMAQGLGMMAGVAGPIALGALALNAIFGKKRTPHTGGAAVADATGVSALALKEANIGFAADKSDDVQKMVSSVAASSAALLNAVSAMQGRTGSYSVAAGYADDSSSDAAWGQLLIKRLDAGIETALVDWESFRDSKWAPRLFGDGEAGLKEWSAAVFKDVREQLGEVPDWISKKLSEFEADPSVDKLSQIASAIAAYPNQILQSIGTSTESLASIIADGMRAGNPTATGEAFAQSIVGGIESSLVGNLSTQITSIVTTGMVTPFVDAMLAGATTSEALSAATMQQTLERVKAQATAFRELWGNADFQLALGDMRDALAETVGAATEAADYIPRFNKAVDSVAKAVDSVAEASMRAERAERKRIAALQDSARKIVETQQGALDALKRSMQEAAIVQHGGMIGSLAVTAQEAEAAQEFTTALGDATDALAELEKLGLADELSGYTAEIGKIVQETKSLLATQVASSRLVAGNAQGALDALMSASTLAYKDFMDVGGREGFNAGAFNAQWAKEQARNAQQLGDEASANALTIQNVREVLDSLSRYSSSSELQRPVYLGIRDAIVEASGTVGTYVVRDAVDAFAQTLSGIGAVQAYQSSGPGLASVYAAQRNAASASAGGWARGAWQMGADVVAYGQALDRLDGAFGTGKINQTEYTAAVEALTAAAGGAADGLISHALTYEEQVERSQRAAEMAAEAQRAIGRAGLASIDYYFNSVTQLAGELAAQASAAAEPIAQATEAIGRMNSVSTAFGDSARAALSGFGGGDSYSRNMMELMRQEGSTTRDALLVVSAADIAAQVMTTADAARVAQSLATQDAFADMTAAGIRDAALLLDGLSAYDPAAFERSFLRMNAALAAGDLTEQQYTTLYNKALDVFEGADEAARDLADSFKRVTESAIDLADALLRDNGVNTLTAGQTLQEMQRQYAESFAGAKTGDSSAYAKFEAVTRAMLDRNLYTTSADYEAAFATAVRDARTLGAMQTAQPGPAAAEGEAKRLRLVGVPAFDVGTNYLPNDMLAMVHQGERIVPAADNRELMRLVSGGAAGNGQVLELLRRILEAIESQGGDSTASGGQHPLERTLGSIRRDISDMLNGGLDVVVKNVVQTTPAGA